MLSKIIKLSLLSAVLVLAGCSDSKRVVDLHLNYVTADKTPVLAFDRQAQAQVAEAATASSGSLEELSAIDMANSTPKAQNSIKQPWNAAAIGMTGLASIDWNGPVLPILKKIAAASNYRVRVLGTPPPIPVLVLVNAENQPLADILRNVMYQVHNKATIKVYPHTKVLELRYFVS
ncbi:MAG: LuxR family transcriptional regulator [Coxiella sp. (in: Bacteria)]|nr:MAG: LuxR family transcriptional regulator [Coxiella sp. (in: g-proteobacteria)]